MRYRQARVARRAVPADFHRHLGIDPTAAIHDAQGGPMHVLDEREGVPGLI